MKRTSNTTTMANEKEPTPAATAIYTVLVKSVKIGGVIAYRTARVNLTKDQAEALNTAQPGTVEFAGV